MGTSYIGEYPPLKCRSTTEMNKMDKIDILKKLQIILAEKDKLKSDNHTFYWNISYLHDEIHSSILDDRRGDQ